MPRNIANIFRYNKFRKNNYLKARIIKLIFAVFIIVFVIMLIPHFFRDTYEVTITNKRIITHKNTNEYFIYAVTNNGQIRVFRIKNNFIEMKYNSADLYWAMEVNRKYEIKAYGFNIPIFSDYQNIVKAKGIPTELIPFN
ncbi:DUF1523 domain-containing protein [Candidatus Clostridium stratigraminis]|uniref:DUF1523 domain-containing protein n=1 Tax=Candidatus Clostridium stratigraminis TaxID=3381661 RepID=A0ABW8T3D1_9CLOT